MISVAALYRTFGLTAQPSPPHSFQLERIGEIFLPLNENKPDESTSKFIHIIPLDASPSLHRVENFIRACSNAAGPNIFISLNRAQNMRFHILSPSPLDESLRAIKILEKLVHYLDGQDNIHV